MLPYFDSISIQLPSIRIFFFKLKKKKTCCFIFLPFGIWTLWSDIDFIKITKIKYLHGSLYHIWVHVKNGTWNSMTCLGDIEIGAPPNMQLQSVKCPHCFVIVGRRAFSYAGEAKDLQKVSARLGVAKFFGSNSKHPDPVSFMRYQYHLTMQAANLLLTSNHSTIARGNFEVWEA